MILDPRFLGVTHVLTNWYTLYEEGLKIFVARNENENYENEYIVTYFIFYMITFILFSTTNKKWRYRISEIVTWTKFGILTCFSILHANFRNHLYYLYTILLSYNSLVDKQFLKLAIPVCCGVRGRALASHTDVRGFKPQCGGRLSSLTCWQL